MKIFTLCNSTEDDSSKKDEKKMDGELTLDVLASLLTERKAVDSNWGTIFAKMPEGVIRAICEDINFAPFQLKVCSISYYK